MADQPQQDNPTLNIAQRTRSQTEDERLLQSPVEEPQAADFTRSDPWRVFRIMGEFVEGFDNLARIGPAVTIFGSARVPPGEPQYQQATEMARRLGEAGFTIITGGGPGIMEAANKGAHEAGVPSVGLGIELPHEQGMNEYVDLGLNFHYFFTRKVMFVRYASGFVVFPGGFGTMDELFEAATLRQTEKIRYFPIVLVGSDYWSGLVGWLRESMLGDRYVSPEDLDAIAVCDDLERVIEIVEDVEHRRPRRAA